MVTTKPNKVSVKVVVRCRPLNKKEKSNDRKSIVEVDIKTGRIDVTDPANVENPPRAFTFDTVYDAKSTQRQLYDETFHDIVSDVIDGYNCTIFAYGQTGTGKTHTMQGSKNIPELRGVIPNSFNHIFDTVNNTKDHQYLVRVSYLEIYMENIRDLLANCNKKLDLKENKDTGIYVKDLSSFVTKSIKEIEYVMAQGNKNRSIGCTEMNSQSSRSHSIFIITVECGNNTPLNPGSKGNDHIRMGKLNLVDLAGSERQDKSGAEGERLKEATKINLSLSALGNVISALVSKKKSHIPYRDSKLTRLLQDSLGGNAKTVMVANIGPADWNYEETITTLRYASRAKNIKNKPKINEDPKDALLRKYQDEIAMLKAELESRDVKNVSKSIVVKKEKIKKEKRKSQPKCEYRLSNSESSSDESSSDEIVDIDEFERIEKEKLEQEKRVIQKEHENIHEEKDFMLAQLKEKKVEIITENAASEDLIRKISEMESKLLNTYDINEQSKQLKETRRKVKQIKRKAKAVEKELELKQDETDDIKETYSTLKEEVDDRTKKLKKVFGKFQKTKEELIDNTEYQEARKLDLELTKQQLLRQIQLRRIIIKSFIPVKVTIDLKKRSIYDAKEDVWTLKPKIGTNIKKKSIPESVHRSCNRPTSSFTQFGLAFSHSFRFKGENIMLLDFDLARRNTMDYISPLIPPKVQAAINKALYLQLNPPSPPKRRKTPDIFKIPKKSKKPKKKKDKKKELDYPVARGLVKMHGSH